MKKIIVAVLAAIALFAIIGACSAGGGDAPAPQGYAHAAAPAKPKKSAPKYTTAEKNAIGSAKDYLAFEGFSKAGLIHQLSSKYGSGYKHKDAVFAVAHIKVNWNKQAVRSAKDYLAVEHFSRAGLIHQLSSKYGDQYTHAQAVYGVNHVGL